MRSTLKVFIQLRFRKSQRAEILSWIFAFDDLMDQHPVMEHHISPVSRKIHSAEFEMRELKSKILKAKTSLLIRSKLLW